MSNLMRLVRPNKLAVRAPRVSIDLIVESKTLGTNAAYSMSTEDVSRSGLLLVWERESKMPFIVNTLIEMTIDPKGSCLSKPVTCLGKVVRKDAQDGSSQSTRFGIQIVQMDPGDIQNWEVCLSELEKKFGFDTSLEKVSVAS
jgi:hypothetical protein